MTSIGTVIGWKFNHQAGMTTRDGIITEFPGGIPSQADQDKWTKEYEDHMVSIAYKEKRQAEYPSIEELVVALYDSEDKAEIDRRRAEIKNKYPKP